MKMITVDERPGDHLAFKFGYNKALVKEVAELGEAVWNPDKKEWIVKNNSRTKFCMEYLTGGNPYARYDQELIEVDGWERPLFDHQKEAVRHILTRRMCGIAGEMGTGKTLAAGEAMERSDASLWLWVAPKAPLAAAKLEFNKWDLKTVPAFMTYERLVKEMKSWGHKIVPQGMIIDESSRIKNPQAQRSQAVFEMAEWIREKWGDDAYIVFMTGTPAPKASEDWWHQCEVARPGFIKENSVKHMIKRLAHMEMRSNIITGQNYPHLVTYWDDEDKCGNCGEYEEHENHSEIAELIGSSQCTGYTRSNNEIYNLYKRLKGLVVVQMKKDCLDLPDKRYVPIQLKPDRATLNAAKILVKQGHSAIKTITLLREISDGFQYKQVESGTMECKLCKGKGEIADFIPANDGDEEWQSRGLENTVCPRCRGKGTEPTYERISVEVPCPKEAKLIELLEQHEECGRLVVYAGFTGSVDRCTRIALKEGWTVFRMDGAGHKIIDALDDEGRTKSMKALEDCLYAFQEDFDNYPKMCVVAHPKSGGIGTTFTKSPSVVYWSNSNQGEDRSQSEDRIHRAGMDVNIGATIYDLLHLPSDAKTLATLRAKRDLELMSMGELREAFEDADASDRHED